MNYLLSCKMFCGYCGSMISAEAGTGKLGKVYRYYKCELKDAIILAKVNDMLTDEMIEKLTVRIPWWDCVLTQIKSASGTCWMR